MSEDQAIYGQDVPKLFTGIREESNEEYHANKLYVNASSLKHMAKSPMEYKFQLTQVTEKTDAMILGSVVHSLLLEGEEQFKKDFAVVPKLDGRNDVNKLAKLKFEYENKGKTVVNQEIYQTAKAMYESAMSKRGIRELLLGGVNERSYYWRDPVTGIYIRVRPDSVKDLCLVDVKTTKDITRAGFAKICAQLHYDIPVGLYRKVISAMTGKEYNSFAFIAIENSAPYDSIIYNCTKEFIGYSDYHTDYLLDKLVKCRETDTWAGVDEQADNEFGVLDLDLPTYYMQRINYQTFV